MQQQWRDTFMTSFRACFEPPQHDLMSKGVDLLGADLDCDGVLRAVYTHPLHTGRLGLIRRLDLAEQGDAPERVAVDIAAFDISEPLGNYAEQLGSPDVEGVRWWSLAGPS
ncbi:hypothetical protein Kisp01_27740 [Kineosporia sp. NBRC 101677]|uniref:hypothetical protein n=1 Tax=Kineosporia sp. NBRC 101677 TaxID=3032197 RepID=UPI0024A2C0A7|nr:hypothetical protein [Kineosporia sp. NBRC 101677]GLY15759.1 hypothetical protein Kisp01_27740 [Kineosporia sp. NBRC 101677]